MSYCTVELSNYDLYLEFMQSDLSIKRNAFAIDIEEREQRLVRFPHCVLLKVAYPELDFANRWCWQKFGAADGICEQSSSIYSACNIRSQHVHEGSWVTRWLDKIGYDFGFNEWYFLKLEDKEQFLQFVPHINWGEKY